jgi:hypothetical protein
MPEKPETPMEKVRALFEKSGASLHALGLAMGYDKETARQSAFQFLKSSDPRISMLQRFARAMSVPLADITGEGHDSRILASGEEVHLLKMRGKKWTISSYDWSWLDGMVLQNPRVFAEKVGWNTMEFETADAAYAFVEKQIKKGKVPGAKQNAP